jgi:ornithine cyclodeaminase
MGPDAYRTSNLQSVLNELDYTVSYLGNITAIPEIDSKPDKHIFELPQNIAWINYVTPSAKALVPFVNVDNMMNLIHHIGIENILKGLKKNIEEDFEKWELFDKTPRIASHSPEGVIELMPTSDGEVCGFKYVNGHPRNTKDGFQTVTAFGLLADVANGYPVLLSEMTVLTALRTAATSAMAASYLAPKSASTMAMIGNGA